MDGGAGQGGQPDEGRAPDEPVPTLADKIDRLFRTLHPPGRAGEFTYEEVAAAIAERGGPTISANYIYLLRRGLRDNPTKKHLEALAGFFRVSPSYFLDETAARQIDAELGLLAALRDAGVKSVALRAAGLSPGSLDAIRSMIEQVRRIEGLPDDPPETGQGPPATV